MINKSDTKTFATLQINMFYQITQNTIPCQKGNNSVNLLKNWVRWVKLFLQENGEETLSDHFQGYDQKVSDRNIDLESEYCLCFFFQIFYEQISDDNTSYDREHI